MRSKPGFSLASFFLFPFSFFLALFHQGAVTAQPTAAAFKLEKVEVGFHPYAASGDSAFKAGLWTPIYATFIKADDGPLVLPLGKDQIASARLTCGTMDAEGTQSVYTVDFELGQTERKAIITYAQPGTSSVEPALTIVPSAKFPGGPKYTLQTRAAMGSVSASPLPLDGNLYLTVGTKLPGFEKAIAGLSGTGYGRARTTAYETDPERLPDEWFGYQAVDLLILTTGVKSFTKEFFLPSTPQGEKRLKALTEWVRRGGHLVLSVSSDSQDKVFKFLHDPEAQYWQVPLPRLLSQDKTEKLTNLSRVDDWANVQGDVFPADEEHPIQVAVLQPDKSADLLLYETKAGKDGGIAPLMVRVPYGMGSLTVVALPLDNQLFSNWNGQQKFWQQLVNVVGPKVRAPDDKEGIALGERSEADVTTKLHRTLDAFNVPMISFGWVALFIFLYILIVGPLDYLILKKVFKRLEWTWITFPVVVIAISVVAYFTAYALKGDQLKINKVDLVDIDLRTSLDKDYKPKRAYAYGTTWFCLLSPRIQNYTIGVQPELSVWAEGAKGGDVMVTWMGRPEFGDYAGMGKSRSAGLFRRSYEYAEDAHGLRDVPIAVWTTKAFTAYWDGRFDPQQAPFVIDLTYDVHNPDQPTSGTIQSNLPVDLEDVQLFYGPRVYSLDGVLSGRKDGKAEPLNLELSKLRSSGVSEAFANVGQPGGKEMFTSQGSVREIFFPTPILKQMYFFDTTLRGRTGSGRNHIHRAIDQSWRLGNFTARGGGVRTAVLVARLARADGDTYQLHNSRDPRLPSHLWLGALPDDPEASSRLQLSGTLVQYTYIRVLVAVRPKA